MSLNLRRHVDVNMNRQGVSGRRDFLRGVSAGGLAAGTLAWTDVLSLEAEELRRRGMACILLWMQGGPSQFETFDPKPGHANGGETKAISTSVSGIQIAENLPRLAKVADQLAIVRSMTTKEGNHQRATYMLHTSYVPTASVHYPTLGSAVAHQIRDTAAQLPAFVRIGRNFANASNGGFLGTEFDAFLVSNADKLPENVRPATPTDRFQRRLGLVDRLDTAVRVDPEQLREHQKMYEQTARMVLSPQMEAFDLSREPSQVREAYGKTEFGNACLLARRMVEAGVPFVEAMLGNWDTHDNNFDRSRTLCSQLDQPFAHLLADLRQRGLLDRTLVVWIGEFGRTPRIDPRGGRDHFPRAFDVVLAGAGIRGGQVIGATDAGGDDVASQPLSEKDLFQSVYHALKIDGAKENMSPIGRPIKLVDGGKPIRELFG